MTERRNPDLVLRSRTWATVGKGSVDGIQGSL